MLMYLLVDKDDVIESEKDVLVLTDVDADVAYVVLMLV